ncbi:MAG: hypothetical protein AB1749_09430 [Pseudomonadota bacterium]
MQAIEDALTGFFERVAQREAAVIAALAGGERFQLSETAWQFSLPDLHAYLERHEPALRGVAYKRFRQALFNCPINRVVGAHGAMVTIAENKAKVDETRYALIWSSMAPAQGPTQA